MTILIIVVGIFLFALIYTHSFIYSPPPPREYLPFRKEGTNKVAVVIGASGENGIVLVKRFLTEGYTVIAASRSETRWHSVVMKNKWQMNKQLYWRRLDVRVLQKVKDFFDEVKNTYSTIDIAANAFMIKDTGSGTPSTILEGDQVLLRMPNGYNQSSNLGVNLQEENSFFTNFIGLWNVMEIEKKHNVVKILNPSNVSPTTNALVKSSFADPDFFDLYLGGTP